jgi:hypothetical protein
LECLGRPLSNILSEVTKVVPFSPRLPISQFPHDDDVNLKRQIQPMASHLIPRPNDIGLDQISSKFSDAKVQSPIYSVFLVAVAYSNRR